MIAFEHTIISSDIAEKFFVCNIEKCKGACCEEGDLGAPLEEAECSILEDIQDKIALYLSPEGRQAIAEQGPWIFDTEGDFSTPTINNRACVYAIRNPNGSLACGIEKAWQDGVIDFQKPISCHLYPIRITKYDEFEALNYNIWDICDPACSFGKELGVPLYKFLKEPLVRKYGEPWYKKLVDLIEKP
jgi:Protein of unknown function (DUF3109)